MYMERIEQMYAACSEIILCCILLPHWLRERHTLMQSVIRDAEPEKKPNVVLLAEELLAIRYVAFIRAVLAQMRYLLLFITVALVLATEYPSIGGALYGLVKPGLEVMK
jgi:hypothetical protein